MVAYDFGIKLNILRRLASFGCRITVVPATWPAEEVLKLNPDGVFFSNGPVSARAKGGGGAADARSLAHQYDARAAAQLGSSEPRSVMVVRVRCSSQGDPSAAPYAVANAKAILGKKPVFGICMGHQILGQAFGGKTFKLKFGHHGGNHPIRAPGGEPCGQGGG